MSAARELAEKKRFVEPTASDSAKDIMCCLRGMADLFVCFFFFKTNVARDQKKTNLENQKKKKKHYET